MKKYLPFLSLAFLLTACTGKPESTDVKTLQTTQQNAAMDTAGLAQFQQWKAQNELNAATEIQQPQTAPPASVKTVEVIREVRVVEKPVRVRERMASPKAEPMPAPLPPVENTPAETAGSGETASVGTGTEATPAPAEEAAKEKGWSKSAKGAAIGGGAGAVIGAVINKRNPAAGAVIGGVLGGAVGYGVGKIKDKKDGRN